MASRRALRMAALYAGSILITLGLTTTPAFGHPGHEHPPPPPPDAQFQKVTLNDRPGEPMDLAVLPNGDVLHTTREGKVWLHDASTGVNSPAGTLDVYQHDEEGLQSIALDPGYNGKSNKWVYLYYSPPLNTPVDDPETPKNEGDAPETGTPADFAPYKGAIRLSRFQFDGEQFDWDTEQEIMDVPVDRGLCCHVGGDIVFDSNGNLILATGDDTNPFQSDGFTPIDERADRNPAFDAQRTSGNTNDLRGKLLRITPKRGGGYTIPKGNLFKPGTAKTRPEIYAMGLRNPFRIEIDPDTDDVWVADYSPDASSPNPDRGPAGHGKWAVVGKPSNFGWPYCSTAELPYVDYDYATKTSGEEFNCRAPVNDSPHNTGLRKLPRVDQPQIWYSYSQSEQFPELGAEGGIGPMAGPSLQFDPKDRKGKIPVGWPKRYDDVPLVGEWTRDWIKGIHLDDDGDVSAIEDVIDGIVTDNIMDMEFGPNGALYILEYGDGYFAENPDAQLARVDFIGQNGNHAPEPKITADPLGGKKPLKVTFSSEGTTDADGDRLRYYWDFEGDGTVDSNAKNPTHTYRQDGSYRATLVVKDIGGKHRGKTATADVDIVVGNEIPQVELIKPVAGQPFQFGQTVAYEVKVTDDQEVDCSRVTVTYILGHDEHGHPQSTAAGCTGSILTTVPGGHDPGQDELRAVFVAQYTDDGSDPPLTGSDEVALEPTE